MRKNNSLDRMSDLETILQWEGEIDNQRIREILGVKPVWASKLMVELEKYMGKRAYRKSARSPLYLATEMPGQHDDRATADEYVRIVTSNPLGNLFVEDARIDFAPMNPNSFIAIAQSIKKRLGVRAVYRSMSTPEGSERLIFPHALVRAPRRWHVRAWCGTRLEFRDFTLGRFASIDFTDDPAPYTREDDKDWNEAVSFYVMAHPLLTPQQQAMIAAEYYPGASARQFSVRRCLVDYVVHDLRLATDIEKQVPPEYQLFVPDVRKLKLSFGR
jgi:hypothetical protein